MAKQKTKVELKYEAMINKRVIVGLSIGVAFILGLCLGNWHASSQMMKVFDAHSKRSLELCKEIKCKTLNMIK